MQWRYMLDNGKQRESAQVAQVSPCQTPIWQKQASQKALASSAHVVNVEPFGVDCSEGVSLTNQVQMNSKGLKEAPHKPFTANVRGGA